MLSERALILVQQKALEKQNKQIEEYRQEWVTNVKFFPETGRLSLFLGDKTKPYVSLVKTDGTEFDPTLDYCYTVRFKFMYEDGSQHLFYDAAFMKTPNSYRFDGFNIDRMYQDSWFGIVYMLGGQDFPPIFVEVVESQFTNYYQLAIGVKRSAIVEEFHKAKEHWGLL